MYSAANASGTVVTTIPSGVTVELVGVSKKYPDWYYVNYNEYSGFVHSDNLTEKSDDEPDSKSIAADVYLRSSAKVSADNKLILLKKGSTVIVTEEGTVWSKVKPSDGTEGYVPTAFFKSDSVTLTSSIRVAMRSIAGFKKNNTVLFIPKNKKVEVSGSSGNWYLVKYQNRSGYVRAGYFKEDSSGKIVETARTSIKLYSATNGKKVKASIPKGANVTVLKELKNWCKVQYGSVKGYVRNGDFTSDQASSSSSSSGTKTVRSDVYFRSGPSTSSSILTTLSAGTKVTVLENGGWCKVQYNGMTGYVGASYLI